MFGRKTWMAAAAAAAMIAGPAVAQDAIKIGNTMPYSGPASAYGTIGKTIEAYFNKVNAEGGVHGRQIEWISYDDGYSPPKTVEQVRRLVEQDQVDILFANAGGARPGPFEEKSEEDFDFVADTNFKGTYFTVQKLLPLMGSGGSIILNTSIQGWKGFPGFSVYAATKAAISGLFFI